MNRVVIPFFLLVHVAPFFYFYSAATWFEQLVVATLQAWFLVGMFAVRIAAPNELVARGGFDFPRYRSRAVLYLTCAAYLALRAPFIVQLVDAIRGGTYLSFALSLATERYANGEQDITPFFNVGTVFFFTYAFLLGAFVPGARHRRVLLALFGLMLLIESSALARAGVVIALVGFFSEVLIRNNHRVYVASLVQIWKYIIAIGIVAIAIITVVGYLRLGDSDDALRIVLLEKLPGYTIASHGALLVWMKSVHDFSYAFGYNTFTFAFKMLGASVPQGMYELVDTSVGPTNVFLVYRSLLDDFGVVGTALIMGAFGLSVMYHSLVRPGVLGYLFLRFALVTIFFAPLPALNFSTVAAGFFLSYLLAVLEQLTVGRRATNHRDGRSPTRAISLSPTGTG